MRLVICGNGLDIHLGFNTRWADYHQHLINGVSSNEKSAISIIEESPFFVDRDASCWSDLESSLTFDCKKYIDAIIAAFDRNLSPNDIEDTRQQITEARAFLIMDPETIAYELTNQWFVEWIEGEYYANYEWIARQDDRAIRDIIGHGNVYVTFNYTPTLEDVYGVPRDRILYIHNRFPDKTPARLSSANELLDNALESSRKKFQFGSTQNKPDEWDGLCENTTIKSNGGLLQVRQVKDKVQRIYSAFSKNLPNNYNALRDFINSYEIDEVVILGHSYDGIDYPYYTDVIVPLLSDRHWTIYCYSGDDNAKLRATEFVSANNIADYRLEVW